ncbi:MAG: thiol reductant ABC exporter subunit CydD [Mycobacteriales bacterium]
MRPLDPRLLRHASATRTFLAATGVLAVLDGLLLVAAAWLVADTVVAAFEHGAGVRALTGRLAVLAAVVAGRAVVAWLAALVAYRAAAAVKADLRRQLLAAATAAGGAGTAEVTTLATRGLDALDPYFGRYLPELVRAGTIPVGVLVALAVADWPSALTVALTLPLIPVFMALVGWYTDRRARRQWRALAVLSHHFLDVVAGLPTLKVFGRAKAQADTIRRVGEEHRRASMAALRVAFLSALVLELLSTLSVALVAVSIGVRLVGGELSLASGLFVLVLVPEAYLPLRRVGAEFHAAAEGLAAAESLFATIKELCPRNAVTTRAQFLDRDSGGATGLGVEGVTVRREGRAGAVLDGVSAAFPAGRVTAVTGPSGVGKSTLLAVLLGLVEPDAGRVLVGGADLTGLELADWHRRVAWLPQRPYLPAGTVGAAVRLGRPDASPAEVAAALRLACVDFAGPDTVLGEDGAGLSAGQRQRIALARTYLRDAPVLLLDEPTAHLDGETEARVLDRLATYAEDRTVVLVTHRPAPLALASDVLPLALEVAA